MNQGHGEEKDGRPWQVEQRRAGGSAEELAQRAEVAPRLGCTGGIGAQRRLYGSSKHGCLQALLEPAPDTRQHLAPQSLDDRVESESENDDDGQHVEGVEALARQHVVVDLQQIERHGQGEQVDEEAQARDENERITAEPEGVLHLGLVASLHPVHGHAANSGRVGR